MICADFLAGAQASHGDPEILVNALARSFMLLDSEQKNMFLNQIEPSAQKIAS
jgi:flagellum-specific peptidoglycan hydrolase FlgJ